MRLYLNTQPYRHRWGAEDSDIRPVLDNIAAAAHACNIEQASWVKQCFVSVDDAKRFLTSLEAFEGHLNSYWFYALLSILEVDEQAVHTTALLARALAQQAINLASYRTTMPEHVMRRKCFCRLTLEIHLSMSTRLRPIRVKLAIC
jgi:hypothetical protein